VQPGSTIIRVEDSEINYLLTHFAFGVAVPRRYLAKTPSIRGPFEKYVLPQHLLSGRVKGYKHFAMWWRGRWLETGWK